MKKLLLLLAIATKTFATDYVAHALRNDSTANAPWRWIRGDSANVGEGRMNLPFSCAVHNQYSQLCAGYYATIEGKNNVLDSNCHECHIEGYSNNGNASYAHVEGQTNYVAPSGTRSHVEGGSNSSFAFSSHIEGVNNNDSAGSYNHIEGNENRIIGGSISSIGGLQNTMAASTYSSVYGQLNTMYNDIGSITIGIGNKDSTNQASTTIGYENRNKQSYWSVCGGKHDTCSNANGSVTFGEGNKNTTANSLVVGSYSVYDSTMFRVGGGTADNRRTLFAIGQHGGQRGGYIQAQIVPVLLSAGTTTMYGDDSIIGYFKDGSKLDISFKLWAIGAADVVVNVYLIGASTYNLWNYTYSNNSPRSEHLVFYPDMLRNRIVVMDDYFYGSVAGIRQNAGTFTDWNTIQKVRVTFTLTDTKYLMDYSVKMYR